MAKENTNRVAVGRLYESAAKYRRVILRSAIENGRILIDGRPLRKKEMAVLLDALGSDSSDSGFGVVVIPGQAPQFGFK
jgi:hypothetical protein